jgi:hypothetical protein
LRKKLLRHNEFKALRRAAMARMLPVVLQIVAVIERQFLARANVAPGLDPDPAALPHRFAIGRATMIDMARRVPLKITVQIKIPVQ